MRRLFEYLLSFFYFFFRKINWIRYFRLKKRDHKNVIWIYQDYPKGIHKYIFGGSMASDFAIINCFIKNNLPFCLRVGKLRLKGNEKKNIFFPISKRFSPDQDTEVYVDDMLAVIKKLEEDGHTLFPPYHEAVYWENKIYMHQQFSLLGINQPRTRYIEKNQAIDIGDMTFPLLLKEAHSCHSHGLFKIKDMDQLQGKISERNKAGTYSFLVQELINMRKDLRVIIIGGEIVLHYWRINKSAEWKPTTTSHGSMTEFGDFPEKWRAQILEFYNKLNLTTAAFDITFADDNLDNPPIVLEVSPSYSANPRPENANASIPYYEYKKKIFTKSPYYKAVLDIAYSFKEKHFKLYLDKITK